jgi:excisionase family DNA binding protein
LEQLYTFKEVAELLKVTRITLERWEKQGILKTVRINNKPRVKESELKRLMKGE